MNVPNIKLSSGYEMPLVGFGLWKVDKAICAEQVYNAIKAGYRCFDGACDYGNEVEAGKGVALAIKDGLVKREDLFLVSKLWNTFHDPENVEPICKKQLADWGIDYFDLYLIHFPIALKYVDPSVRYPPGFRNECDQVILSNASTQQTWTAMESLVDKKLVRSIGISNFNVQHIMDLLRYARIRPATLQIEHHPYLTQPDLVRYAQKLGIALTAYSSFGSQSFVEFDMESVKGVTLLMEHPDIKSIAEKHNKAPSQVLLRWATQRGIAVIPKTNDAKRLALNLDVTGFDLAEEDIAAISKLNRGLRFNNPTSVSTLLYYVAPKT
ncbi:D-xylose reductase [Ophidiomyces ophidiicola]|nr:D-xylose reductase [Ophidiomyces ophidiicola]